MSPFALRSAGYFGVLAAMLLLEQRFPFVSSEQSKPRRLRFHLGLSVGNTAILAFTLAPLTYAAVAGAQRSGLAASLGLRGWAEIAGTVLAFDLWDYWMHLASHRVPFFWRFHRAHHSDMEVDVTTASRFHLGELVISGLSKILMILLWGPSLGGLVAFEALLTAASQFHHSNLAIALPIQDGVEKLFVTPRMHRCHHALHLACFNTNFASILSVWDRIFRSYRWARDVTELSPIGLFKPRGEETMQLAPFLLTPVTSDS